MPILRLFGATPVVCHAMNKHGSLPPVEVDPDATDRLPTPDFGHGDPEATGSWAEGDRPGSHDEDDVTREMRKLPAGAPRAEPPTTEDAIAELNRILREQAATIARLESERGTTDVAGAPAAAIGPDERGALEERLQRVERERLDFATELDEHRAAFARMEDELGVAREAAAAAQRQREAAEQARQAAEQERDRLQAEVVAAEAARRQAVARADEVSAELATLPRVPAGDALEQERQHLKDRIAELRNAVTVAREEVDSVSRERDELRRCAGAGGDELEDLRAQLAARGQQVETLLERLRSAEALRRFRADFRAAERSRNPAPTTAGLSPAQDRRVEERQPEAAARPSADGAGPSSVMDEDPVALQWRLSMLAAELARREERITELEDEVGRQNRVLDGIREGLGLAQAADPQPGPAEPAAKAPEARREPPRLQRYLTRLDGKNSVVHVISQPRVSVGRSSGNDLQIRETYISRHHASILIGPDNAIVEDAGSSNGVFLNDRRVRRELLRDGDIVAFGKARYRYQVRKPEHAPD